MMPQYSEERTLRRLGADGQLPAWACAHVTRPRRHCGLDVIRSTGGGEKQHGQTPGDGEGLEGATALLEG